MSTNRTGGHEAREKRGGWQPITTAPLDQRVLIGWFEVTGQDSMTVAFWHSTRKAWCNTWMAFSSDKDQQPTHWMPLPDPPPKGAE